jgi:glycosyltransferase involved in cell wall biosynthesis
VISIIIPTHRAEGVLPECISAVRRSADAETEIIVVDDDSPDRTAAVAEAAGCKVVRMERRSGAAACRNAGAAVATGDILVFMAADVKVCDGAIPKIRAAFQAKDCAALVGRLSPGSGGTLFGRIGAVWTSFNQGLFAGRGSIPWFWAGLGAVRSEVFKAVGPFNENCGAGCDDVEFGCDMAEAGHKIVMLNDLTGVGRDGPGLYPFFRNFRRRVSSLTEMTLRKGRLLKCPGNWRHVIALPLCYFMAVTFIISPWWWPGGITSAVGALVLTFGLYREMYKSGGREHGFFFGIPAFYTHVITNLLVPFAVLWGMILFVFAPRRRAVRAPAGHT